MEAGHRIKTRNPGEVLPSGERVPEFLELTVKPIKGDWPEEVDITAFGFKFERINRELADGLLTLEKEGVMYADFWDEASQTFCKYRIAFRPAEIYEYVEASIADQEFVALLRKLGDEDAALDAFPKRSS
jgi:hypothetical protein